MVVRPRCATLAAEPLDRRRPRLRRVLEVDAWGRFFVGGDGWANGPVLLSRAVLRLSFAVSPSPAAVSAAAAFALAMASASATAFAPLPRAWPGRRPPTRCGPVALRVVRRSCVSAVRLVLAVCPSLAVRPCRRVVGVSPRAEARSTPMSAATPRLGGASVAVDACPCARRMACWDHFAPSTPRRVAGGAVEAVAAS